MSNTSELASPFTNNRSFLGSATGSQTSILKGKLFGKKTPIRRNFSNLKPLVCREKISDGIDLSAGANNSGSLYSEN